MNKNTINKLKNSQIEYLLDSADFHSFLKETSREITSTIRAQARNEATVEAIFEIELYVLIRDLFGLRFYPEKEKYVDTIRHVAIGKKDSTGRIDSRIGALIIEYKYCSKIKTPLHKANVIQQLLSYINALREKVSQEYVGFITDGIVACFISVDQNGNPRNDPAFEPLSTRHLETILKTILLLNKSAFTPENLVKDFCTPLDNSISRRLIKALVNALIENKITSRTQMLFNEWKELFRLAHDDQSKQKPIQERRQSLSGVIGSEITDNETEYKVLYAIQTAYAIIIKIIAYKFIGRIRFDKSFISFSKLATASSEQLRSQLQLLEEGAIFRSIGIGNLLEGDFFAWYCTKTQWASNIFSSIQEVFSVLREYEDAKLFTEYREIQDLFKDLFIHIMPEKVRHSLGEYYTPEWLADNLVTSALEKVGNEKWTGLDPCCGSGTFVMILIKRVLRETAHLSKKQRLFAVLERIKAIDLNPLAVLTTRINYFINIAPLISDDDDFEIPVYLGDSSYVPQSVVIDNIKCYSYEIRTLKGFLKILLPQSTVYNHRAFSRAMTSIENDIVNQNAKAITDKLIKLTAKAERKQSIQKLLQNLSESFVELEKNEWNGIWARIVTNFLTTANIGRFDIIAGNPPWIDWKNLPEGYRDRIKSLCLDRKLFSGDSITGGINLNVCALIANVAADNWLKQDGVMAFLMPENLVFQQSYEGFRNFYVGGNHSRRLYFQNFFSWSKAGHPFYPVQYPFLSFFISSKEQNYKNGIPVKEFVKKKFGHNLKNLYAHRNKTRFDEVHHLFDVNDKVIGAITTNQNSFTFADSLSQLKLFSKIAGVSEYTGRDGIDFYPVELFLLNYVDFPSPPGTVLVTNHQNTKAHHKLAEQTVPIEKEFLFPLIRSLEISKYHISKPIFLVPFPYHHNERSPISRDDLSVIAERLMTYYNNNRNLFKAKTTYNAKIIGEKHNSEYYAIARVGRYTYADHFVVFRKDTKWVAAVVSKVETPWGELKSPRFLSHAVSICERSDGTFISINEAHYICAILNSPAVVQYILKSSDKRSFPVRLKINLPLFDEANAIHIRLSELSREAHNYYNNKEKMSIIDKEVNALVHKL